MSARGAAFRPGVLPFVASVVLAAGLASLFPWGLGLVAIGARPIAWTAVLFATFALALGARLEAHGTGRGARAAERLALLAAVTVLAWLWHRAGGVLAPLLLAPLLALCFGLGVLRGRGAALAAAVAAFVAVAVVVVLESRDLRQEVLVQGPRSDRWLERLPSAPPPEVAVAPAAEGIVAMLAWLAIGLPGLALLGAGLGREVRARAAVQEARAALASGALETALLDALPLPLVLVSREGEVLWRNAAFVRRFVFVDGDVVGRPLAACVGLQDWHAVAALLDGGPALELPESVVEVDGERRVARIEARPVAFGGAPAVLVLIQDVTEAARLKEAVDAGPPLAVTNRAGAVLYANAAGRAALLQEERPLAPVAVQTPSGAATLHLPPRPGEKAPS